MSRRGINPCLICGEETLGPKAGTVCPECLRKVKAYDELRARTVVGTVAVRLQAYPSLPGARRRFDASSIDAALGDRECNARGRLELLLRELRGSLDRPATQYGELAAGEGTRVDLTPRLSQEDRARLALSQPNVETFNVPAPLAQFLVDLDHFLLSALREAEEDGKRQGSNLLAGLAAGELTNSDFERRAGIGRDAK